MGGSMIDLANIPHLKGQHIVPIPTWVLGCCRNVQLWNIQTQYSTACRYLVQYLEFQLDLY